MSLSLASKFVLASFLASIALPASAASLDMQKATSSLNLSPEQLTCAQAAAFERETAIMNAFNAFYTRQQKTLEARRVLIKAAWEIKDGLKRRSALKAIWKKFGYAWRDESAKLSASMRSAWEAYRTGRSDCKIAGYDDEAMGYGLDAQF
jgi:hypothetical protein